MTEAAEYGLPSCPRPSRERTGFHIRPVIPKKKKQIPLQRSLGAPRVFQPPSRDIKDEGSANMDEELPVDDRGASSSPAPEEDAQSIMSGSANNAGIDENLYGDRKTSYIGPHQLGVVTDLPVDDSEGMGFE